MFRSQEQKEDYGAVLKISGFNELSHPRRGLRKTETAQTLCRIFTELHYQLGVLSPEEATFLQENRIDPPKNWLTASRHPKAKIFSMGAKKIAVILFPWDNSGQTGRTQIVELASELRRDVDLLIGLSPWGINQERSFFSNSPNVLNILLGSGPGPGFKSKFVQEGTTLWVRPYGRGKVVFSLRIKSWPSGPETVWRPGKTVDTDIILLKDNIPEEESISSLLN